MRLAETSTVSNYERRKPPYVGVTADSVIRLFFPFLRCGDRREYEPLLN